MYVWESKDKKQLSKQLRMVSLLLPAVHFMIMSVPWTWSKKLFQLCKSAVQHTMSLCTVFNPLDCFSDYRFQSFSFSYKLLRSPTSASSPTNDNTAREQHRLTSKYTLEMKGAGALFHHLLPHQIHSTYITVIGGARTPALIKTLNLD